MDHLEQIKIFMAKQEQWNQSHQLADNVAFVAIQKGVDEIKDNHLAHVETAISDMKEKLTNVSNDVSWLKRFFWLIATASIGGLLTGVVNLLLKIKGV